MRLPCFKSLAIDIDENIYSVMQCSTCPDGYRKHDRNGNLEFYTTIYETGSLLNWNNRFYLEIDGFFHRLFHP